VIKKRSEVLKNLQENIYVFNAFSTWIVLFAATVVLNYHLFKDSPIISLIVAFFSLKAAEIININFLYKKKYWLRLVSICIFFNVFLKLYSTLTNANLSLLLLSLVSAMISINIRYDLIKTIFSFALLAICCSFWFYINQTAFVNVYTIIPYMVLSLVITFIYYVYMRKLNLKIKKNLKDIGPQKQFDTGKIHKDRIYSIGQLSASLGHEISTPLTNIGGHASNILTTARENNNELVIGSAQRIKDNLLRVTKIVHAMRRFSSKQSEGDFQNFLLKDLLKDVDSLVFSTINLNKINFKLGLFNQSVKIFGDEIQITQVLVNLIKNAVDELKNTPTKNITLNYQLVDGNHNFYITDSGNGIPHELKEKIYTSFFSTKKLGEGTGLGLHISRLIAKKHHGKLYHELTRDGFGVINGTKFILSIPVDLESKFPPLEKVA